jgi:DNA-directed RNA polymerase specialized sigma24 family protein
VRGIDAADIQSFCAGEPDAVRAVYRHYGPAVFAVTHRMLGNRQLAEDATQQTFVQAWKAAARFDEVSDAWEVRRAIDALPPDEREVVRLQHLEGRTHIEIAERLGVPVGTVKSRSHRAHQHLATRLAHLRREPR